MGRRVGEARKDLGPRDLVLHHISDPTIDVWLDAAFYCCTV